MRALLIAAPILVIATAIPVARVLWRSIHKRDYQLALQCLPGLWAALLSVIFLVAHKVFGVIPGILVSLGRPDVNLVFMYVTATVIVMGLAKAIYQLIRSGTLSHPIFSIATSLAMGLFVYGLLAHSNVIVHSAEAFVVSGLIGITEALWAAAKKRDAAYDSALGHSGPALVISSVIIGLAFTGM